jgi:DNA-binding LacI/PurR family transcriptional regulator
MMGKRKPSMRDVAEKAGVSVSAVSLVVRNKPGVADETRERVWDTIARLGYVVAGYQEDGRAAAVGLLIERGSMPAVLDMFYGEVIRGFQAVAEAQILIPAEWMPAPLGAAFQRGYMQMREVLKLPERPTAVVAVHDKIAFSASVCGSPTSSAVTSAGPSGPNVSKVFPIVHWLVRCW